MDSTELIIKMIEKMELENKLAHKILNDKIELINQNFIMINLDSLKNFKISKKNGSIGVIITALIGLNQLGVF